MTLIVNPNHKIDVNNYGSSSVINSRMTPIVFGVGQDIARQERAAGEAAILAKLDVEQQAEAAMAKAPSHLEVYATVSGNKTHGRQSRLRQ